MKAVFTLIPSSSKRLIALGVKNHPAVKQALAGHKIIVANGITNAYVAEELLGITITEKYRYTAGIITQGLQCVTAAAERLTPYVLENGNTIDTPWTDALASFGQGDVFIKGGNAFDHKGLVGIMVSSPVGGTIGAALSLKYARGFKLVVPIGLEKMIPDVALAAEVSGINTIDCALGQKVGLVPVMGAEVVNELTALELLFKLKATCIAAGGVGGSEGAVTIVIEGAADQITAAMELIKKVKKEPALKAVKQKCQCGNPCNLYH